MGKYFLLYNMWGLYVILKYGTEGLINFVYILKSFKERTRCGTERNFAICFWEI